VTPFLTKNTNPEAERLSKLEPINPGELSTTDYDGVFATLGYEERASYIANRFQLRSHNYHALAFSYGRDLAYDGNKKIFEAHDYSIDEIAESLYYEWLIERLRGECKKSVEPVRLLFDISSMTRRRIAASVAAIIEADLQSVMVVDFAYAYAVYSPPPEKLGPVVSSGIILDFFKGATTDPERPIVAICGLGYELDRAVGVIEDLEPVKIWAFHPTGHDVRFDKAIRNSNETLWELISHSHVLNYNIGRPMDLVIDLESVTFGAQTEGRVVIIPFGPKIFTLAACLVGLIHRDVMIWRVSAESRVPPSNQAASGKVVALRLRIVPRGVDLSEPSTNVLGA
jgi:hypothetical protein